MTFRAPFEVTQPNGHKRKLAPSFPGCRDAEHAKDKARAIYGRDGVVVRFTSAPEEVKS